jgi:hypothetical protein
MRQKGMWKLGSDIVDFEDCSSWVHECEDIFLDWHIAEKDG